MRIQAPAVGVDAAATPGSAGSAVASYQRSIVSTEFVAEVFDWTIPKRVAPEVVTIIWPTTELAGRLTASVVKVGRRGGRGGARVGPADRDAGAALVEREARRPRRCRGRRSCAG
jgi:hypothetical protein